MKVLIIGATGIVPPQPSLRPTRGYSVPVFGYARPFPSRE